MEPASSTKQTDKITTLPADIIKNRRLAFLFAQDLFGIKKELQKPFTEKYHHYTVRDITARCLLKFLKDQKPGTEESCLFAETLLALIDFSVNTNQKIIEVLKHYLKIEEHSSSDFANNIKLTKFNTLSSCLNIDQNWIIKNEIVNLPFIHNGKIIGLLPKIMEVSLFLLPSLPSLIDDCLVASKPLKALHESVLQLKDAAKKSRRAKDAANINAKPMNEKQRKGYERYASDELIKQHLKTTKRLCRSASKKHYDLLISLQNMFKIDPIYCKIILDHIIKALEIYTTDFGKLLILNPPDFEIDNKKKKKIKSEGLKIAISVFTNAHALRNEALNKVQRYGLVHYRLLRFVLMFANLCVKHIDKNGQSETNAKNLIAEIEALERKRQKKIKLVSEERIEEYSKEEEIETEIPIYTHDQEVKLLSPKELLEKGLKTVLEDFLQKNDCNDLFIFSQSAAFLCHLIHKNPHFIREEYPKLEIYESRALRAAFKDASDHLFLSSCGFEIFAKSLQEGKLFSLALVLRMLILDWHGVSEQARRVHFIVKFKKTNENHHLLDFLEMENGATKEYLQALDNGLIWSRYPVSNSEAQQPLLPLGLHWMKFCYKLQSKILHKKPGIITDKDIHEIHQLIEFICACQFNAWLDACQLLCKGSDFGSYSDVLHRVKVQMKAWASSLKGKQFAEMGAENVLEAQQEILGLLTALKRKKKGTSKEINAELGNIKWHLTDLHTAVWLRHKNDKKRFEVLFDRNLLNLQWVLESSYRILAATHNIKRVKDHDFSVFQNYLGTVGMIISEEEEKNAAPFNLSDMLYYPRYVSYTRGNLSRNMTDILAKIKAAQRLCLYAENDLSVPPLPDQSFQNGLRVLSTHLSLIVLSESETLASPKGVSLGAGPV